METTIAFFIYPKDTAEREECFKRGDFLGFGLTKEDCIKNFHKGMSELEEMNRESEFKAKVYTEDETEIWEVPIDMYTPNSLDSNSLLRDQLLEKLKETETEETIGEYKEELSKYGIETGL